VTLHLTRRPARSANVDQRTECHLQTDRSRATGRARRVAAKPLMAGGRAEELDRRLGTPGLHKVGRRVESTGRKSVLPGDLVRKYENGAF